MDVWRHTPAVMRLAIIRTGDAPFQYLPMRRPRRDSWRDGAEALALLASVPPWKIR